MKKGNLLTSVIVGFIVISILMVAVGFITMPSGDNKAVKEMIQKERQSTALKVASVIAASSIDPIYNEDDFVINETINNVVKSSDGQIIYVYVIDKDKIVWGDTKNPGNVLKPFSDKKIKSIGSENQKIQEISDDIFDVGVPILAGKKKIGEVHLGMKKAVITNTGNQKPLITFIIMFVIGLIGTIVIAVILSNMLNNVGAEFATSLKSAKLEELRKQEAEVQKHITSKNQEIKNAEKKLEEINAKIKELGAKYDEVTTTLKTADEQIEEKKKQVEFYENKVDELVDQQKNLKDEIEKVKQANVDKAEITKLENQIKNFKLQLQQVLTDIEVKRKEEIALTEKIKQLKAQASQISSSAAPTSSVDLEKKKKEEIEITQRIVAKRKEEIALSQRIELKRKKELELTGRIELLEKKLKELGNK